MLKDIIEENSVSAGGRPINLFIGIVLLFVFTFFLAPFVPEVNAQSVRISGRTIGKSTVQLRCTLSASVARNARQIAIGRAFGSSNTYSIIARTGRRVRVLTVKNKLTQVGQYRFMCRVIPRRGKVRYSNVVRATLNQQPPTPTPPPQNQDKACSSTLTNQVLQLVNQSRAGYGRTSLGKNSQLTLAAQRHTADMAKKQVLTHGTQAEMVQRIRNAGFTGSPIGENIAVGQTSAQAVMTAWLNSAGHRANILDSRYRYIGVGCVIDRYGRYWWTQNFGG